MPPEWHGLFCSVGVSCVQRGEELYHIRLAVFYLAVLPAAGLDEGDYSLLPVVVHRAAGHVVSLADLLLCPQVFIGIEYAETLKCLGHSLRHLAYLAVEAVPHASDL